MPSLLVKLKLHRLLIVNVKFPNVRLIVDGEHERFDLVVELLWQGGQAVNQLLGGEGRCSHVEGIGESDRENWMRAGVSRSSSGRNGRQC